MKLADNALEKLSKIIKKSYAKNNIEDTLELIRVKARLEYKYNQRYADEECEELIKDISERFFADYKQLNKDEKTVLFYDGFGEDTRGLVRIYLKALISNKYRVIYVTSARDESKQPYVMSIIKGECANANIYHLNYISCCDGLVQLKKIFDLNSFSAAFLYTTPFDVVGICAFDGLINSCRRYQINLTDHAFWLGIYAHDFCIEFRNYGAAISRDYRNISAEKLIYLPYYPLVSKSVNYQGFPFDVSGKKIIFSGGAIYKTIDKENTFYRLIENIICSNEDVVFVYASDKTCLELETLLAKYPNQIHHIEEREDLMQLLENSYLYLNTYPISGALMLQYAVLAGCIPVTLKRSWDDDASGVLINEEQLGETFVDFNEVVSEINKLLQDEAYYNFKRRFLNNQVISEDRFTKTLDIVIKNPNELLMCDIKPVRTEKFRRDYDNNMSEDIVINAIIHKGEYKIYKYFPCLLVKKIIKKATRSIEYF